MEPFQNRGGQLPPFPSQQFDLEVFLQSVGLEYIRSNFSLSDGIQSVAIMADLPIGSVEFYFNLQTGAYLSAEASSYQLDDK